MISHPNIIQWWVEWEFDTSPHAVLVIQTDLDTVPRSANFDSSQLDDMLDQISGQMDQADLVVKHIRIVPREMHRG